MRLTLVALALTTSTGSALAAGPDLMGTWSANCKTQPEMRTLHIDFDSVQVVDRRCKFVRWTKTDIGWHSALACSTEGVINTGQILVVIQSPSRILVDMDGLNGTFNRCPR